jgi:hypothetical protein
VYKITRRAGIASEPPHRRRLTSDHQPHWRRRERVLRGEIRRRHLALPLAVVELKRRGADPQAAVAGLLRADPLVLLRVDADRLRKSWETHIIQQQR